MLVILVLTLKILFAEARVFCQDVNAMGWQPLGFSCPITCGTIKTAVEQIQQADIDRNDHRTANTLPANERKHIKLYQTYHRLLSNEKFKHALKEEARKMTAELNKTYSNMTSKYLLKKIVSIKCTTKLYKRSEILEKFTNFLNVYADPKYPFDEEMAGMILQKLERNLNHRNCVVDYKRILAYLRKTLKYHRRHSHTSKTRIIKLQPKNCLTLYKPGCYCRNGYVENNGECVIPENCIANQIVTQYLERIILY